MHIAVFGGSFDPLHVGHEAIINEALKTLKLDQLVIVPTFLNPLKTSSHLTPEVRLKLLQKNFEHNPRIIISDYEIQQNKPMYTYDTLQYFIQKFPHSTIDLIVGMDNYQTFHLWHQHEELSKLVNIVVATRNGFLNEDYDNIQILNVDMDISSTQLRDNLDINYIPEKIKNDVIKYWH